MRPIPDMDTVQIELTDACMFSCSNCTRFCGHKLPWFMGEEDFKRAVDSMVDFPKMTGFMGGEPLLHPKFEEFCEYARSKIKKDKLGLWTCLPKGYERYAKCICDTFGHIFINDHSRNDIFHGPVLVAAEEIFTDKNEMFYVIDHCWLQNGWSASINRKGAFFCEIAAAMAILFDTGSSWAVEPGWWWRTPKDFKEQIEEYCPKCGCAVPLARRASVEGIDDISPGNYERIKSFSKKIKKEQYKIHDLKMSTTEELNKQPMAAYKDTLYRSVIAARYSMCLAINEKNFQSPILSKNILVREKTIFQECKDQMIRSQANV